MLECHAPQIRHATGEECAPAVISAHGDAGRQRHTLGGGGAEQGSAHVDGERRKERDADPRIIHRAPPSESEPAVAGLNTAAFASPVAQNIAGCSELPRILAMSVLAPGTGPSIQSTDAVPSYLVMSRDSDTEPLPPVTSKLTVMPDTPTDTVGWMKTAVPTKAT